MVTMTLYTLQNHVTDSSSPLLLMKAVKNAVERQGMRNSHVCRVTTRYILVGAVPLLTPDLLRSDQRFSCHR